MTPEQRAIAEAAIERGQATTYEVIHSRIIPKTSIADVRQTLDWFGTTAFSQ
jgi:hypothetical protein